jgi:UDP-N-acetylglucosamine 4-epimerase
VEAFERDEGLGMMSGVQPHEAYAAACAALRAHPRRWLVTGSAGFIGSHLVEALLRQNQEVVSLDNFATGHRRNLDEVRAAVGAEAWRRHRLITADIADIDACHRACEGASIVLHQAALGSVPGSIEDSAAHARSQRDRLL